MQLDEQALEKAVEAAADSEGWNEADMPITRRTAVAAVTAYLAALPGEPVGWTMGSPYAPHACHVLAAYFDEFGEWIVDVVLSPPASPYTFWRHLPAMPGASPQPTVTEDAVELAARFITAWMGFSWDGLNDGRVTDKGFPIFTHGQFGWGFQGRKGDMIDLARACLEASLAAEGRA